MRCGLAKQKCLGRRQLLSWTDEWTAPGFHPSSNTLQLVYQQPPCHTQLQVYLCRQHLLSSVASETSTSKTVTSVVHLHNLRSCRELNLNMNGQHLRHDPHPVYLDVTSYRTLSASVVNHTIVTDPTIWQASFDLTRQTWSLLNCFWTGQGPCHANLHK